jgi:3-phenylpropionate/trans-cinnamate dioxygenase ferredoxin reductase subunit
MSANRARKKLLSSSSFSAIASSAVRIDAVTESEGRIEHWTNASEQANVLAANLLGSEHAPVHDPVPYVWSDQYDHKIQILGSVSGEDRTTMLRGRLDERRFAVAYSRDGRLRGLVAFDMPREIATMRPAIADSALLGDVV